MTARSSSFLCPKFPNAPTSAAAFAHRLSSQRSSPSCLRPAAHWHLSHKLSSQRFSASAAASPQRQHCTSVICDIAAGATPSTKMPILCSKRPKRGGSEGKNAQKPRFCAQNARKQGFQTPKTHKNADFVLEMPENVGSGGQKSTKTSILCSGGRGLASGREEISIGKHNMSLPANHLPRF